MTTPSRVVVRAPNWLGDVVMAAPSVRAIRRAWPEAVVDVALPAAFAPLVPMIDPALGAVPLAGKGVRGLAAQRADAAELRAGGYDLALLLTNSFGSAWVMRQAGIPERWGYRRDARGFLLTRAVRPGSARRTSRHHADYYAALVDAVGLPRPPLEVRLHVPAQALDEADTLLRDAGWDGEAPLLACAPGAAYGTAKQWPPALVARVASRWTDERKGVVVLVGAVSDRPAAQEVIRAMPTPAGARAIDMTGGTSLAHLAALLARASRVLANDSGAMHLAAAVGTPVVTVFGPTDEHATSPLGPHTILTADVWCRPCMLRECPIDHRCMTRVTPERVMDALG